MKIKKKVYYGTISSLTIGASTILGLLSFSGMYMLLPILPICIGTFILSVAYEGEIYLQNIKKAYKKLFKKDYQEIHATKKQILKCYQDEKNSYKPQFFKDYIAQLELVNYYKHQAKSKKQLKIAKKDQKNMEKWFTTLIYAPEKLPKLDATKEYIEEVNAWLAAKFGENFIKTNQSNSAKYYKKQKYAKLFSLFTAVCMTLSSYSLIAEACSLIPALASISFASLFIMPMAIISGIAYGL